MQPVVLEHEGNGQHELPDNVEANRGLCGLKVRANGKHPEQLRDAHALHKKAGVEVPGADLVREHQRVQGLAGLRDQQKGHGGRNIDLAVKVHRKAPFVLGVELRVHLHEEQRLGAGRLVHRRLAVHVKVLHACHLDGGLAQLRRVHA